MKPWQKKRQEQDEFIRNMQKLSQPDFYSYFKLISQPPYNEIEIKREATLSEAEYKSAVPPAEEGYDDINAVFPAVVTIPLQKTLHYWCTHHAPDIFIDKELLSPNDIPTDLVDVYEYLCSLDKTERNNTYKRADLHPVLISKIEASVAERTLDEFSSIIASNLQDTKVLLHLLSTMQRIMPFSTVDEFANWPAEDLKGYLQSLDFTQAIDETFQKHLHLPQNERDEAIAKAIYSYTGRIVAKYYEIQHLMSSEEQAIVDGIIHNPLFPIFIQYCIEIEGGNVEQEQPTTPDTEDIIAVPEDLFDDNKVKKTVSQSYMPGLKKELKQLEIFRPLFNYILDLGGITSEDETGALLRVFTGYPVDNAVGKPKWEKDYHVLYYLVKYMFTSRHKFSKLFECIDISYPSDDEKEKAEQSASSYAERISGKDKDTIINNLHKLSDVFPALEQPIK